MKTIVRITLCAGMLLLALSSCKTTKMVSTTDSGVRLNGEELLEAVAVNTPVFDSFASRLKLSLPTGKGELTLHGYLKMQRDELVQLSLQVPILRTEAVRIEFSSDRVLVIDRINKRYADASMEQLREVLGVDVSFYALQALFSNAFFLPGKTELKRCDYAAFEASLLNEDHVLLTKKEKSLSYAFAASRITNRLMSTTVGAADDGRSVSFLYDKFVEIGNTTFPSDMQIVLREPRKRAKIKMELSRVEVGGQRVARTEAPAKYQPVALTDVFEKIKGD